MRVWTRTAGFACVVGLLFFPSLGCEGDGLNLPPAPVKPVALELYSTPEIDFNAQDGTTTLVIQFVARDNRAIPLHQDDLEVEMLVEGRPIDVEGILQEDSEELTSNVHLTLVLDASYSMLQHDPPAFLPMLSAARRTINSGRTLYLDRPGVFDWQLYWFNDVIFTPVETTSETLWHESDIERIAAPGAGTFTKLYAAVKTAAEASLAHADEFGAGPRDQHIVVAFSDGADNYSWFGNGEISGEGSISSNRGYRYFGAPPVTGDDVEQLLEDNPNVQMHVMGLGSDVNDGELRTLARAGSGQYFKNVDASEVDTLFDKVILELTSVQTQGVTIPIQPGNYTFRVVVREVDGPGRGELEFQFRGGDADARVLE